MLNELENKIRKAIPELNYKFGEVTLSKPIQLNHVLEYLFLKFHFLPKGTIEKLVRLWNLKSNLLSDQSEELIKYINEL